MCNNQYMFNFQKNLHDFLYENEYCGKTKNLTLEIFLYVLDKIFIVNLKKKFLIFGDTLFMNFKVKVKVTRSST